ncbi:hypothetical protein SK803_09040 [Lentzea sp. BCCO 10_0856]|uniref:Uncharacterized protein n=1 Tax=Lentzea miocenica TaxID=3095431 RepID=A0ABU4SWY8_9PSEU|nr:hypothetical protein [Lentzea sp. BCCO 10_0856]MDX8030355.1 hypothetical protein [Lentzea sp. BCCO 10_0856]
MPIEQQQSGSVEPATQVFAKITIEEATVPATTPVTPAPAAPTAATPATAAAAASARQSKSLTRRLARRILGPTLMTKK